MGVRFRYTTNSFKGNEVEVVINDSDYAGSEGTFEVQDGGIEKTYEGQGGLSPFDQRIIPSTLTLRILEDGSTIQTLFDDVSTSKEGRFTVQLYIDSVLDFSGVVLRDQGELIDGYREFWDMIAVCGLSLLKNYNYDYQIASPVAAYPDRYTNHFIEIFKKIKAVAALYGDSDEFIQTYTGFIHDEHPASSDPFYHTGHGNFYWNTTKGFVMYDNCYDVLNDMLEGWNARCFQSKGMYTIESVDTLEDAFGSYFAYAKDKSYSSQNSRGLLYTISGSDTDNSNSIRGSYGYMPGLQKIILNLDADEINLNLISGLKITGTQAADFAETVIFYVTGSTSLKVFGRLYFWCLLGSAWNDGVWPNREDFYYKFQIRVKLDDVYINSSAVVIGNKLVNPLTNTTWTASPTNYITFYVPVFPEWVLNPEEFIWQIYGTQILFESATIPKDGDLSIEVIYDQVYELDADGAEVQPVAVDMSFEIINDSKIIISDDSGDLERGSESIPFTTIVDVDNTHIIEKTLKTGDIIADNLQQLYVNDGTLVSSAPVWQKSSVGSWEHESFPGGLSTTREKQIIRMMGKMQSKSIKTYSGTIYTNTHLLGFNDRISYRSVSYAALGISINYLKNICYGKWFALTRDDAWGETTPDPEDDPRRKVKTRDIPISPGNIGLPDEATNPNAIKPFLKSGTLSNTDTIDTTSWTFTFPTSPTVEEMDGYIDFFVRNTKYRYTESDPMPQNTWKLDGTDLIINRATTGDYLFRSWNWFS